MRVLPGRGASFRGHRARPLIKSTVTGEERIILTVSRSRYRARSTNPLYFWAFWLLMAFLTIGVPLIITHGH